MTFLSWQKDYQVGVPQIDSEHRYLFELINKFHERYRAGGARRDVLAVLSSLVAYAEEHFQHEEALMSKISYPRLEDHKEQHEKLFFGIFDLFQRVDKGTLSSEAETLLFLKKWLLDHILHTDMDIGTFLRRRADRDIEAATEGTPQTATPA